MALTIFELLASLGGLCVLSLLTVLARYSLICGYRSIRSIKQGMVNQSHPSFIELKYGRLGFALTLLGLYIPIILLCGLISYKGSTFDNPDMDDWEQGPGVQFLRCTEGFILLCQIVAVGFGVFSWRTSLGPIVLVTAAAVIYGIAHGWLGEWYTVITHF